MFGGYGGASSGFKNDLWWYEPGSNTWTQKKTGVADGSPLARGYHSMIWDGTRVIMFGGYDGTNKNDLWWYYPVTNTWEPQTTITGGPPSARYNHSMIWDGTRVIMFGGWNGYYTNDLWWYDPTLNTWIDKTPASSPSPRQNHSMVWDGTRMIMFGGYDVSDNYTNDLWWYDPASGTIGAWIKQIDQGVGTSPLARSSHSMVWDPIGDRAIMFGGHRYGYSFYTYYNDLWWYDPVSNAWAQQTTVSSPSARYGHSMVWDNIGQRVIMFGGSENVTGYYYKNDLWWWTSGLVDTPGVLIASTISSTQINLSWTNVGNETGYKIERKFGAGGTYTQIATMATDVGTFNDTTVTPANTYYYRVRATNADGDGVYSPEANATTVLPSAPTALNASTISSTQISLSWTSVINTTGYKIERGFTPGGPYTQIGTTTTDVVTYNDTTVTPGNTYYYQVRAYNIIGDGGYSPEINAGTIPPSAPTALTATMIFSTQINLSWTDVTNTTGYKIERKFGASGFYVQIATTVAEEVTYFDTTVTPTNTYYYHVRAYNGSGDGGYSPETNATPMAPPSALTATAISSTQIALTWTNVANETGYKIERSFISSEKPLSNDTPPSSSGASIYTMGYRFKPLVDGQIRNCPSFS
jgi:hypothetical protein